MKSRGSSVTTEVLESWDAVSRLAGQWDALLERSPSDTVFLRWSWIEAWRDAGGCAALPCVVLVRGDDGGVIGLAPLYRATFRMGGLVRLRALRAMADHATGAVYADWIVDADRAGPAVEAIARALAARRDWDCIWMRNLATWTGARDRIVQGCQAAGFLHRERLRDFAAFTLPDSVEAYWASLSRTTKRAARSPERKMASRGPIEIQRCTTPGDVPRFLEALFDLHHRRWATKGDPGAFQRKPLEERFYRGFAPLAAEKGWLRITAARQGDAIRAIQYGYAYRGAYFGLQEGFDPECEGVGNLARVRMIEGCIQEGIRQIDFLAEFTENKRRWGAQRRDGCDILIGRRSLKARTLFRAGLWPTGRFMQTNDLGD